jgi:hypothetical protein
MWSRFKLKKWKQHLWIKKKKKGYQNPFNNQSRTYKTFGAPRLLKFKIIMKSSKYLLKLLRERIR